jgi:hypothetical protein
MVSRLVRLGKREKRAASVLMWVCQREDAVVLAAKGFEDWGSGRTSLKTTKKVVPVLETRPVTGKCLDGIGVASVAISKKCEVGFNGYCRKS